MRSTAWTAPSSVSKRTERSADLEEGLGQRSVFGIEDVAKAVAEEVERERGDDDREAGVDGEAAAPRSGTAGRR